VNNEDDDDQDLTGLPLSLTSDASWGECAELLARAARRTRNWKLGYMAEWAWARAIGKAGPAELPDAELLQEMQQLIESGQEDGPTGSGAPRHREILRFGFRRCPGGAIFRC